MAARRRRGHQFTGGPFVVLGFNKSGPTARDSEPAALERVLLLARAGVGAGLILACVISHVATTLTHWHFVEGKPIIGYFNHHTGATCWLALIILALGVGVSRGPAPAPRYPHIDGH